MENRQTYVNLSFLVAAALAAYVVFALTGKIAGTYDLEARIPSIDLLLRGISLLVGFIVFFVLYKNDQSNQYMNEVVVELSRVTWPGGKETYRATIVVVIMVMIAGFCLGGLDWVWTQLVSWVL